jgi:TatD DNase family protein
MRTPLVDFHCHLDLYPDHAEAVAECEREKVFTLAVTTTPKAWPRNNELAAKTRHVRAALGLHPQLVAERASELSLWKEYLPQARYVGEVGLDAGPRFYRSLDLQKHIFTEVLHACSQERGKILTVHSVRAVSPVLDLLENTRVCDQNSVVLHWFTGTKAEGLRAASLGCYFSINAEMLIKPRHCESVSALPPDRLLTETDGPFTQTGERPARPVDVRSVVEKLAGLQGLTAAATAETIYANLGRLVSSRSPDTKA